MTPGENRDGFGRIFVPSRGCQDLKSQIEKVRGEGWRVLTELAYGRQSDKENIREMSGEEQKQALALWSNHHIHCTDRNGHSWSSNTWMPDAKAWLWGPRKKCGIRRLMQASGNCLECHQTRRSVQAFTVDNLLEAGSIPAKLSSGGSEVGKE